MKNVDSFTYVTIMNRYIFEKFCELMIDLDVSRNFTARYEQYLAFKKHDIDSSIDLDINKVGAVHVQFEIESIWLIESLIVQISIELVKFHMIKIDTFCFLSLVDLDRLKAYFNNVINILNQDEQNRKFSVICRFDHDFLLQKNVIFIFDLNLCYLIEIKLRQLHRRFDHSLVIKLYYLLEQFMHDVKKLVLKKLIKFCTFCQKHDRFSERFRFVLKNDDNINFNYLIIVDVMYIDNNLILYILDEAARF
jgi:hypothetical protein